MSVNEFEFSKNWNDAADFPTHEPDERQVRADIQLLYDEIKSYINDQIVVALNNIAGAVESLTNLTVPDNSITYEKLHRDQGEEAVDTGAIRNGAITSEKIGGGEVTTACLDQDAGEEAVTTETMRDGAVTTAKLDQRQGYEAVTTETIRDEAVTKDKLYGKEVPTSWIADEAITRDKIAGKAIPAAWITGELTGSQIGDGAIDTDQLAIGAVESDNIAPEAIYANHIVDHAIPFLKLRNFIDFDVAANQNIRLYLAESSRAFLFTCGTAVKANCIYSVSSNSRNEVYVNEVANCGNYQTMGFTSGMVVIVPESSAAKKCLLIVLYGAVDINPVD